MRVFVAGGTGAVGRYLIPALIADGHQISASTRSAGKSADLAAAGAVPVVMDGLGRDAVLAAVRKAEPEVIVNQMTSPGLFRRIRNLEASVRIVKANGQPGAVTYDRDGHVVNVFALDIADGPEAPGPAGTG